MKVAGGVDPAESLLREVRSQQGLEWVKVKGGGQGLSVGGWPHLGAWKLQLLGDDGWSLLRNQVSSWELSRILPGPQAPGSARRSGQGPARSGAGIRAASWDCSWLRCVRSCWAHPLPPGSRCSVCTREDLSSAFVVRVRNTSSLSVLLLESSASPTDLFVGCPGLNVGFLGSGRGHGRVSLLPFPKVMGCVSAVT